MCIRDRYRIARLLSTDVRNLCVTGDPDQSIYSWRGANPAIVSQFETDYPDRRIVRLEENYRSTALILAAADGLIRFNANRKHKDLVTSNPVGEPVTVYCHNSDDDEANFVAGAIREAVDSGERRFSDFAVFVRMTSLWGRLETALRGRQVPYRVVGGQSYFQRKEIKDALAYARLACNPRDDSAFERVANSPPRGIGDTTLAKLRKSAAAAGTSMAAAAADGAFLARAGIKGKPKAALAKFGAQLAEMRILAEHPPATALEAILDAVDFRDKLEGADEDDRQERLGNVEGMLHDAAAFGVERPDARLADFLEMVGLLGAGDERDDRDDRVTVMTLHAAKGLEFPVVFIIAFEHDVMPHERAVQEGSLEEERRLAFVGITRAREKLALSYVQKRFQRGANIYRSPSPFLGELPADALRREDRVSGRPSDFESDLAAGERYFGGFSPDSQYEEPAIQIVRKTEPPGAGDRFRPGMMVDHPRYGHGRIVEIDGSGVDRKATIQFPSVGRKRFVLAQAQLEPI